ncbi:mastermind-like protein 2 [Discoglossus pictus]
MPVEQGLHRKTNNPTGNTNCDANDMFNLTLKDIKKEPGESMPCSNHLDSQMSHDSLFKYVDDMGDQFMDPDLQELFNELTYISVPPMSDIELQNMINITIKQDDSFNIDIGQQTQRNTSTSSIPMDKIVIKSEYPQVGSPQMRPSSTGPPYSMSIAPLTSSPNTVCQSQSQIQVSSGVNRSLSNWQELSHAQQLKQIAANRQQHSLIQQHHTSNWPNVSPTRPSSRPFGQEKVPSPFRQQQLSPHSTAMSVNAAQPKGLSNYLYKPNPVDQNNHLDVMNQQKPHDSSKNSINANNSNLNHNNTKPLFHFNADQTNQQASSVMSSQSKSNLQYTQQQQPSSLAAQQQHDQTQQSKPLPGQTLQRPAAFQQKMITQKMQPTTQISGLHYPAVHQQQDQHSAASQVTGTNTNPGSCPSPSTASAYSSQQPLLTQQLMDKTNILQRQMIEQKQQLILQQQMLAGTEKSNTQDQLNRHLTRPPPDYKDQRRGTVSMQQASQYNSGLSPISNSVSTHSITPQNSGNSSASHGPRMSSLPGVQNVYGNIPCAQQVMYNVNPSVNQMQQQTNQNQLGTTQNKHILPRQSPTQGNNRPSFVPGSGQFRSGVNQGTNMAGQRPPNVMVNSPAQHNWVSPEAKKHDTLGFPNSNQSHQGGLGNQQFSQRAMTSLNQISPGVQLKSLTPMSQATSGQTMEPLRAFSIGQAQLRAQILPNLNQAGGSTTMTANTFTSTNPVSRAFLGTDNDLGSFDFLSQNNNGLGSALNSDSDFIDALLKTGHNNDDWMKDINLDEIFRNSS